MCDVQARMTASAPGADPSSSSQTASKVLGIYALGDNTQYEVIDLVTQDQGGLNRAVTVMKLEKSSNVGNEKLDIKCTEVASVDRYIDEGNFDDTGYTHSK